MHFPLFSNERKNNSLKIEESEIDGEEKITAFKVKFATKFKLKKKLQK